jgi:pSer/pThr/pTyr-binding forkhead associated (FHA) protein
LLEINRNSEALDGDSIQISKTDQKADISVLSHLTGIKDNIQLNAKMIRIGKDPDSDIVIKSLWIGKTAAVVNQMSDGWYINYVGGISKLRVNNKVIKKSVKLNNLDIITIGSTKLQFLILRSADQN